MTSLDFSIEYHSKSDQITDELAELASTRLRNLRGDHTDMISASVTIEPATQAETPHDIQAQVVVHMRPERVVASHDGDSNTAALKGALDAVERQVREQRRKFKEHWKRPDLDDRPSPR